MNDREKLRQRAESVLKSLNENPKSRPIIVEFSGTPKSGKSSCIEIVSHFFRRLHFRVLSPSEGASRRTPYHLRADLVDFNTWSASYALTHILESLHDPYNYQLVILDRGMFDALAWFQLLVNRNEIDQVTCDQVHSFLLIEKWRSVVDEVFLFTADPDTSMKRENQNALIDEPGTTMNLEFLQNLNAAYNSVREKYSGDFSHFQAINTSASESTTPQSTAAQIAGIILDRFDLG